MKRVLVSALTVLVLAGVIAVSSIAPATAADNPPSLERLASCVQERGRLNVVLLIDESGSLGGENGTDPANRRVDAVRAVLHDLQQFGSTTRDGVAPVIEVDLAGFSVDFADRSGWVRLDAGSTARLDNVAGDFAARNDGVDTDYAAALLGAQEQLATRTAAIAQSGQQPPCKAVLWFTDGKYDIEDRVGRNAAVGPASKSYAPDVQLDHVGAGDELRDRGREVICRSGGVVDQLRQDGTTFLVVALDSPLSPLADNDKFFLQGVADGSGPSPCGAQGSPSTGLFVSVGDVDTLLETLDRVASGLSGGTQVAEGGALPVCAGSACEAGRRQFLVEPPVDRFHVLAVASAEGIVVELRAPGVTDPLVIKPGDSGTSQYHAASMTTSWVASNAVTIDGSTKAPDASWFGSWSVTFVDPTGANPGAMVRTSIFVYSDVSASVVRGTTLRLGENSPIPVRVTDFDVPTASPGGDYGASISGVITDPASGQTQALDPPVRDGDRYVFRYQVPSSGTSTELNLALRTQIVTKSGVALAPTVTNAALPVMPPVSYPAVRPTSLRLGTLDGTEPTSATLTIVGGKSNGCVWFGPLDITVKPSDAGHLREDLSPSATSQRSCIAVSPGERKVVTVTVTPQDSARGSVAGSLGISRTTAGSPDVVEQQIPVGFEMTRPVDEGLRLGVFLLLLLPALLLPLLVLWFANWLQARFAPTSLLSGARVQVRIESDRVVDRTTGEPFRLREQDFALLDRSDGNESVRDLDEHGVHFRARAFVNPFRAPTGEASTGTLVGAGSQDGIAANTSDDGRRAMIGLGLRGVWVLVVSAVHAAETTSASAGTSDPWAYADESSETPATAGSDVVVDGDLVVFIAKQGRTDEQCAELTLRIEDELPALARRLGVLGTQPVLTPSPVSGGTDGAVAPSDPDDDWFDLGSRTSRTEPLSPEPTQAAAPIAAPDDVQLSRSGATEVTETADASEVTNAADDDWDWSKE